MINKATLELIKSFEGLELKAYKDAVGVWTIGYGHTAMAGGLVPTAGMTITKEQAEALLLKDLKKYEDAVHRFIRVPLTENQYGALVSFTYNLGPGNLEKSTLRKKINAKDYKGAAQEFLRWDRAGGKVLRGLTRRREAEKALYETAGNVVIFPGTPQPEIPNSSTQPSTGILKAILDFILKIFRSNKA